MNDLKVVIDAGHGGSDSGAVGNGVVEKDLNLKIANYMYDRFKELGVPVKIVRSTDETVSPTERVNRILNAFGNTPNVVVISNHINAAGSAIKGAQGAEVIYALRNDDTLAKKILSEIGKEGQVTRSYYQRRSTTDPTQDYYFILRNTKNTQPVIVEYGFIDNATDIDRVQKNYKRYVDAVVRAVLEVNGWKTPTTSTGNTYVVQNGDTLWNIAKRFDTTVAEIKRLNNLTSDALTIGQVLELPNNEEVVTETTYTVKSGDTLWKIANQFNMSVSDLKLLNNLTSDNIAVGQVLILKESGESPSMKTYIVKSGDTLWKIANEYNTTVADIKRENNLTSDSLSVGQLLKLPITESQEAKNIYIVKSGDSLWKIATQNGVTVSELMAFNQLPNSNLSVGQILYIPKKS